MQLIGPEPHSWWQKKILKGPNSSQGPALQGGWGGGHRDRASGPEGTVHLGCLISPTRPGWHGDDGAPW